MKELLTESEWVQLFQKANFRRVTIAGGGTIAETISGYIEEPEWNVSQFIPNELYEAWVQHENVRLMYQHILGHRILYVKIKKSWLKIVNSLLMLNEK